MPNYFPAKKEIEPKIYAYKLIGVPAKKGLLKIGYTIGNVKKRIDEQIKTARLNYDIVFIEPAIRNDGSTFTDHDIHRVLEKRKVKRVEGEWFRCSVRDVKVAFGIVKNRKENVENRDWDFKMRPEQEEAVRRTKDYFKSLKKEKNKRPHFLWNAKMRFGKTFATYKLAQEMKFKKILILTFKPAVESAWEEDLMRHKDFEGWQFYSRNSTIEFKNLDFSRPVVVFGSLQDYLGRGADGGIKPRNKWVHKTKWDLVVFDEYHYGAWNQRTKNLFKKEDKKKFLDEYDEADLNKEEKETNKIAEEIFAEGTNTAEEIIPIRTNHYLYLSGTPFRAIASGEFIEEQIFNWTYSDEQEAKENWDDSKGPNPYAILPKMIMMTYQVPDSIKHIAEGGEFNEFDLNVFFKAKKNEETRKYEFVYKEYVQKWLDLIRGSLKEQSLDDLKLAKLYRQNKPYFPFQIPKLRALLNHTLWYLPSVAACYAMENLLKENQNTFYHDFKIVVVAGPRAGNGVKALKPVLDAMDDPLKTKTITLSTGKLTTGVTVRPWTGVFMLRNLKSPETYFQTAFRVQSPWVIDNPDGKDPNKKEIIKKTCYVFDFAPNRALSQIADYSQKLNPKERNPEKNVQEFIKFLPILAYDGSTMKEINATGILDIVTSGTTATLLARRWESALLVNVDNATLQRLINNKHAMEVLSSIEGFRSLNRDLETIINKSENIKRIKKEASERKLTEKERKELSEEEKEYRNKRKEVQQKLIKFATRIPIFMYLTDYREYSLQDVIRRLEPKLFKKVTGLTKKDFSLLVSLGVFNEALMNDAVYKFKRYEDASLEYAGINKHKGERIGGYSTTISEKEYKNIRF